jgi:hypothetical protein
VTEPEWLVATDPTPMLEFLRGKANDRKLRLFAVACCRRVWHLLPDERSRKAVEVAERYADGKAVREEVLVALSEAKKVKGFRSQVTGIRHQTPKLAAALALSLNAEQRFLIHVAGNTACLTEEKDKPDVREQHLQCDLLRDIFGNPFRLVTFDPSWRTDTAMTLAKQMYESRDFSAMPIMADALQDAGCDSAEVLDHCRDPSVTHVRGCWVVDLVLGRE